MKVKILFAKNSAMWSSSYEGFRLTKLKEGADYIEDDANDYQHITTSVGYWVVYIHNSKQVKRSSVGAR